MQSEEFKPFNLINRLLKIYQIINELSNFLQPLNLLNELTKVKNYRKRAIIEES